MPLTGAAKGSRIGEQTYPKVRLRDLEDQLDHEWALLRQEDGSDLEVALRSYFHADVRLAVHWVNGGDLFNWDIPETFLGQRLAKVTLWLKTLHEAEPQALKLARAQQVKYLRHTAWPAYRERAIPEIPDGRSLLDLEVLPMTWEGVTGLWQTEAYLQSLPADKGPAFLPQFTSPEIEAWHCVCIAVLVLNRMCRYALADLTEYPTGDGR